MSKTLQVSCHSFSGCDVTSVVYVMSYTVGSVFRNIVDVMSMFLSLIKSILHVHYEKITFKLQHPEITNTQLLGHLSKVFFLDKMERSLLPVLFYNLLFSTYYLMTVFPYQ